jgi:hypothetical protein
VALISVRRKIQFWICLFRWSVKLFFGNWLFYFSLLHDLHYRCSKAKDWCRTNTMSQWGWWEESSTPRLSTRS